MFIVRVPTQLGQAAEYIVGVLFGELLQVPYEVLTLDRAGEITIEASGLQGSISLASTFLEAYAQFGVSAAILPKMPLPLLSQESSGLDKDAFARCTDEPNLPLLFGQLDCAQRWVISDADRTQINFDLFGGSFYLITRIEELAIKQVDLHGRFPFTKSIQFHQGLAQRPLVNEYVEFLWQTILKRWPQTSLAKLRPIRTFSLELSHDVDRPFLFGATHSLRQFIKRELYNASQLSKCPRVLAECHQLIRKCLRLSYLDPWDTFDTIMTLDESVGCVGTFNFFAGLSRHPDPSYSIHDAAIQSLMKRIIDRGHKIGLHGGYYSIDDAAVFEAEYANFCDVLARLGLPSDNIGGRQHYLRWSSSDTWRIWNNAGLKYDSSVGWAETPGFRAGVCYQYSTFDLKTNRPLKLLEQPLVVMDQSLFNKRYLGLTESDAFALTLSLKRKVHKYAGKFTLLWHNDFLAAGAAQLEFYRRVISS